MEPNNESERWSPVSGYEGRYEVSDFGRFRSLVKTDGHGGYIRRSSALLVVPSIARDGRRSVGLYKEGRVKRVPISVLVLTHFVGPRPFGMECCHRNGIAGDDRLGNLKWASHAENMADSECHGTAVPPPTFFGRADQRMSEKMSEDAIRCIRAEPAFHGVNEMLARAFVVHPMTIGKIRNRHSYKWVEQYA